MQAEGIEQSTFVGRRFEDQGLAQRRIDRRLHGPHSAPRSRPGGNHCTPDLRDGRVRRLRQVQEVEDKNNKLIHFCFDFDSGILQVVGNG